MREYLRGNDAYREYFFRQHELSTSLLNLIELYYILLKDEDEQEADKSFLAFKQFEVEMIDDDVRRAMKFRLACKAKKENISYSDAIGYTMAKRLDANFLTGDDAFKGKPQVEFLK
jgi:predicted nucleic acid-binding protein